LNIPKLYLRCYQQQIRCLLLSELRPRGHLIRFVATEEKKEAPKRLCFISFTRRHSKVSRSSPLALSVRFEGGPARCILICTLTDSFPILIYKQITLLFKFPRGSSPAPAGVSTDFAAYLSSRVKFFVPLAACLSPLRNLLL